MRISHGFLYLLGDFRQKRLFLVKFTIDEILCFLLDNLLC